MNNENPKILSHLQALTNQVKRIAVEAGELIYGHYDESGFSDVIEKNDGSPVTIADQEGEKFIIEKLKGITGDIPIVGEEMVEAGEVISLDDSEYYWLVDALDGTKGFIKGDGDFTVNIALIRNGKPVLGVIYAPHHEELYAGFEGGIATRWLEESKNEKEIRTRSMPKDGLTIMTSYNRSAEKRDQFLESFMVKKIVRRYSSIKICSIAQGKADLYPCLGQTCFWDTAAGDAILRSAGSGIVDLDGNLLEYTPNKNNPKYFNKEFLALSQDLKLAMFP